VSKKNSRPDGDQGGGADKIYAAIVEIDGLNASMIS